MSDKPRLGLQSFEWSAFVASRSLEAALIGGLGAVLGLIELDPDRLAHGVVYSVWLSIVCVIFAFARVWKSIREEHECTALWDQFKAEDTATDGCNGVDDALDRFFELPYVLTLLALPLSTILWQAFASLLLIFYLCDNFYNRSFIKCITAGGADEDCADHKHGLMEYLRAVGAAVIASIWIGRPKRRGRFQNSAQFETFFRARYRMNQIAMVVIALGLAIATALAWNEYDSAAVWVGVIQIIILALIEIGYEPRRNIGMPVQAEPTAGSCD